MLQASAKRTQEQLLKQIDHLSTMLAEQVTSRLAAEMHVKQLQAQQQDMMLEILHLQSELNAHQATLNPKTLKP